MKALTLRGRFWLAYLAVLLLFVVGGVASAFAAGTCEGWDLVDTTTPYTFPGNQFGAAGDAAALCVAAEAAWGDGVASECVGDTYAAAFTWTNTGGAYAIEATRVGCTPDEPAGVEYVATVANPAPVSIVGAMVATFLLLIWWVIFK